MPAVTDQGSSVWGKILPVTGSEIVLTYVLPSDRGNECMSQTKKSLYCFIIRIHGFQMCHLLNSPAAILSAYLPAPVSSHIAEDTQANCCRTAAAQQHQWTERTAQRCTRKLQRKCSVPLSEGPAIVIQDRVQLSLCDQIGFVNVSDNFQLTSCARCSLQGWWVIFLYFVCCYWKGTVGTNFETHSSLP